MSLSEEEMASTVHKLVLLTLALMYISPLGKNPIFPHISNYIKLVKLSEAVWQDGLRPANTCALPSFKASAATVLPTTTVLPAKFYKYN
jgi:hypothetical protein